MYSKYSLYCVSTENLNRPNKDLQNFIFLGQAGAELCQAQGKLRLVRLSVKNLNRKIFLEKSFLVQNNSSQ